MTREQYIDGIADALLRAVQQRESLPARQAAEGAWYPGHPLGTVEAIEAEIISRRAEDAELIAQQAAEHRIAA
jgi:hypothetical protein